MRKTIALALVIVAAAATRAQAQLPIHLSVNAGAAVPLGNDADELKAGLHVGAGLKIALIPLQFEAAYDRMGSDAAGVDHMAVTSYGVSFPVDITPPLLPISVYVLAGGSMYHQKVETSLGDASQTKAGLNAGAGLRLGIPGIKIFVEGRGHYVFNEGDKLTYATIGLGLRL